MNRLESDKQNAYLLDLVQHSHPVLQCFQSWNNMSHFQIPQRLEAQPFLTVFLNVRHQLLNLTKHFK